MLPETYKKIMVTKTGNDPHTCLALMEDVPMKAPSAYEVVVRNQFAGVNTIDIGRMLGVDGWQQALPFDFGTETLGEVVAVGKEVDKVAVGDVVMTALPGNGFREYTRIAHNLTVKMPAPDPRYVGTLISGTLAKIGMELLANVRPDDVVIVTSGLGASGHFALQLALNMGCYVITTCKDAEEAAILERWDPNRIVVREQDNLAEVLATDYPEAISVVFDTMGGQMLDACIAQTAPRARVVLVDAVHEHIRDESPTHTINFYRQVVRNSLSIMGINLSDFTGVIRVETLKLLEMIEQGLIESLVDGQQFEGIAQVPDAIGYLMSGAARGKVIVKLDS